MRHPPCAGTSGSAPAAATPPPIPLDILLAYPRDGRLARLHRFGDAFVPPAWPQRPLVGLEQDPRMHQDAGRGGARRDQLQKLAPFGSGQCDRKLLLHTAQPTAGTANTSNHK